jgi:hypothetical protein
MSGNFSLLLGVFLFFVSAAHGTEPSPPHPGDGSGILLLRNGRVIEGRIGFEDGYYTVTLPDQEFRVRASEVEFSCHDLREGYRQKRGVIQSNNIEQHLQLFLWCERQGLMDCAAEELKEAEAIDNQHPMISVLRRRLKIETQKKSEPSRQPVISPPPPSDETFDRMTREMPPGTVEKFVQVVQPILLNHCPGAIGFTLPGQKRLQLMRPPLGEQPSRRTTLRNLYAVLECINWENPGESPLLKASVGTGAIAAVGSFPGKYSAQYEQLNRWVYQVAQKPMPFEEPASVGSENGSFADLASGSLPAGGRTGPSQPLSRPPSLYVPKRGNKKGPPDADGNRIEPGDALEKPSTGGHSLDGVHGARKIAAQKASQPAMDAIDPYDPATFNNQSRAPTELPTPAARVLSGSGK